MAERSRPAPATKPQNGFTITTIFTVAGPAGLHDQKLAAGLARTSMWPNLQQCI
jgi:hypothetical protein